MEKEEIEEEDKVESDDTEKKLENLKKSIKTCPECGEKCNCKDNTLETIYVWCTKCPYQTLEPKHPVKDGLIHEIKEIYQNR